MSIWYFFWKEGETSVWGSFWNWVHLKILSLEKQCKKNILPCIYSCTVCMLLASMPHAMQFSQLQRVNCDSLLGLWCLLPNQVDQSLLHWQKALGPWEGQLTCQAGYAPMENGIFSVSQDGVFPFLVESSYVHFTCILFWNYWMPVPTIKSANASIYQIKQLMWIIRGWSEMLKVYFKHFLNGTWM